MKPNSPPLVPNIDDEVYLVVDDIGSGPTFREMSANDTDKSTVIRDIMDGQYEKPIRVIAFNTNEGWSRDVTEDIGREIRERAARAAEPLGEPAATFVEWATGESVPAALRGVIRRPFADPIT